MNWERPISRREALKLLAILGSSYYLRGCASRQVYQPDYDFPEGQEIPPSPIERAITSNVNDFTGDDPKSGHHILRDIPGYLASKDGTIPPPTEFAKVAIVGGGMSGLLCTYLLKDLHPILFEQDPRFGGNSKGESWEGIDYPTGAAYFVKPDPGSQIDKILTDLDIYKKTAFRTQDDPIFYEGQWSDNLWTGGLAPQHLYQFQHISKHLQAILSASGDAIFPEIPTRNSEMRTYIDQLDALTLHDYFTRFLGEKLNPVLYQTLEKYCYSVFAASSREVSAASGLNFLCSEFSEIAMVPGGNAAITEQLWLKLKDSLLPNQLRNRSTVFRVEAKEKTVWVTYETPRGDVRTLECASVIMTCPKFIVRHILEDIEDSRIVAIKRLKYRAYLVASAWINAPEPEARFFDVFNVWNPEDPDNNITDFILANDPNVKMGRTVMNFYRPFPTDDGRGNILAPDAYEKYKKQFENEISFILEEGLGIAEEKCSNLRIARWAHGIPVSAKGLISERVVDELQQPFRKRVFFVSQDNWALPSFETCATEALQWTQKLRTVLNSA